nr:UvrABC system protein A [Chlamydiota bacterium]
ILAPFAEGKKGGFKDDFQGFLRKGFMRARVDGKIVDLNEEISLDKNLTHDIDIVIDRLVIQPESFSRVAEAVMSALEMGSGVLKVLNMTHEEETLYSTHAYSQKSGLYYSSLEPHDFSFNSPTGMCPSCHGMGRTLEFDLNLIIDTDKSIAEDCCQVASSYQTVRHGNIYDNLAELYDFDVNTPWKKLSKKGQKLFLYGTEKKWTKMHFVHPTRDLSWSDYVMWRGVLREARERYEQAKSVGYKKRMEALMINQVCSSCQGSRLRAYPAATLLSGKRIADLSAMTIADALQFFQSLQLAKSEKIIAEELLKEITERLQFLIDVGLHYLSLNRTAPTLSGGESQRVRLASQVGCGLVGITYVLDEPSVGLHPRDNKKLIATLSQLRNMGNTVIVVEHDEETIWAADRVVDFGPGPGRAGGEIIVNGSHKELLANPRSITGAYLSRKRAIPIPKKRRKPTKEVIKLFGACHNNLKKIDVKIPLEALVAVTGVSGSGKSSLIVDTLHPILANALHHAEKIPGKYQKISGLKKIDKVIAIDQSPIGRNPRSNPATYIKIFDEIRSLFSRLPESVARGYQPGRFSFNVRDGSCPQCHGMGMLRIDMDFMEDQWVSCGSCKSRRFDHETLSVLYKGKSIYDVLEMTVAEALEFFTNIPSLKRKLEVVAKVGMGYITLGQPSTTLSGGEAQRIKLARELVRPPSGNTFYILDEPTTGLHFHDIKALIEVLQELVDRGNSVLIIEHNMDVVKVADWVIDLGPDGGEGGGEIVAAGSPEKIAKLKSATGKALAETLQMKRVPKEVAKRPLKPIQQITIQGAEQNNLKHLDLTIPRGKLTVCTGPSGSGKSSLAFETIYAEGQRRYIESLSPYARQFVRQMPKPKLAQIEGLSPAIAIEQKAAAGNPRSTVGTMTEIYDYLRILFTQAGTAYCPETGEAIRSITKEDVVSKVMALPTGEKCTILAPIELEKNQKFEEVVSRFRQQGYLRLRLNGEIYELDQEIPFDRRRKNAIALVIDRLKISPKIESRLFEAMENALKLTETKVLVAHDGEDLFFNLAFAVESTGKSYPEVTAHTFSFNSPAGMCFDCQGLGYQYGAHFAQNPEIMDLSITELLSNLWTHTHVDLLKKFLKMAKIDPYKPLKELSSTQQAQILGGGEWMEAKGLRFQWLGIQPVLAKAAKIAFSEIRKPLTQLLEETECASCLGSRLNPLARNVRIEEHSIGSLCHQPISKVLNFIDRIRLDKKKQKVLEEVIKELNSRLRFLEEVGLHYLSLDRRAPTLSNGEAQRIRLARQLGSSLTGIMYVLDEPTIGLHPHDNARLNSALKKLKELGNTLLLVEHDPQTIATADYLLDFGPGAGNQGGHITARGSLKEILKNKNSLTGAYLSGRKKIKLPAKKRKPKASFTIEHANKHNLKDLSISIPMGLLTCLTGVSGSGKSTLLNDVIRPFIEATIPSADPFTKLIVIDQNPIGHTARSDVGTYVEALPIIRQFYASLALSKVKGLQPKHFSYNHRRGMCTHCWGMGYHKVEMYFLPAVRVLCEQCLGLRLNPVSLEVEYHGKNFGQLLGMTVEEAQKFFEILPKAKRIFDTLISVGLGYLKLGQGMATLSGGEAQRMKLSRELSRRTGGKALYLLDEPTTGLHPDDINTLLQVLHRLVDKGHTMILIEHNLDVIKNVDHIIDLGPEAGEKGGELICQGTPQEIAAHPTSYTGKYLREAV